MYLIVSHFGISNYLKPILKWNRELWGDKCIFIGDKVNRSLAIDCGWIFYNMDDLPCQSKRFQFLESYKDIAGISHQNYKNGRNWLRYVFERWFIIEELVQDLKEIDFLHFDSDVLLTSKHGLNSIIKSMRGSGQCTTQCNDMCLNGYVTIDVLSNYTSSMIQQFNDKELLQKNLDEFETEKSYAFTEMRAFQNFRKGSSLLKHGLELDDWIMDDCLAQSQGFLSEKLLNGRTVKKLFFDSGICYITKDEINYKKICAINFSWLETSYIRRVQKILSSQENKTGIFHWSDLRYLPKFIKRRLI
ncbi:hypothetical protein N9I36_01185 [Planktomarina temperata]|nr:hypothetical protein [Planktomarina temperata]